jgi:uncharacterized protein (DUF885 family)
MSTTQQFVALCGEIIDGIFRAEPEFATWAGVHAYDSEISDFSISANEREARRRADQIRRLESLDTADFDSATRLDYDLILSHLRGRSIHDEIRMRARTPDPILDGFCWGVFTLSKRSFATLEDRLECAVARLEQFPRVVTSAKEWLTEPSPIPLDIAINSVKDTVSFFEKSLPLAFVKVQDEGAKDRLRSACSKVANGYREFAGWLDEQRPRATHPFAIGGDKYERDLRQEELVDLPLARIWEGGKNELDELGRQFTETARQIDPTQSPAEVFESMSADHPPAEKLLAFTSEMLEGLRQFCTEFVTFPSENRCQIEPTPEFARELTFASMDVPGPFETKATEAFYNVTTPLPEWDAKTTEQHMRAYNTYTLTDVSIHEAYPGHYTQFLWMDRWPSKVRKLMISYSAVEGWAHYSEHLMVEAGYMHGDLKLRLAQIQEALLRACRMVVGIGLHTGEMTIDESVQMFKTKAYMEDVNALRETRRGTTDPFYCNYTLGKLMFMKLRSDYMAANPGASLKQFHDAFLAEGVAPIPLVRRKLLGSTGAIL